MKSKDGLSLEEWEKQLYRPAPSPYEAPVLPLTPAVTSAVPAGTVGALCLNGTFSMAADGDESARLTDDGWADALPADVPCTVATALFQNGKIPDPMVEKNDRFAREAAYHTWWFRREFTYDGTMRAPRLVFDGVCHKASFWLNGTLLGTHTGMFAGPDLPVGGLLRPHNVLIVRIDNDPVDRRHYSPYADFDDGWQHGVVLNCVYGWHYASIPSRGIWRDVWLRDTPLLQVERPFVFTEDLREGTFGLCIRTCGTAKGTLHVTVGPENFCGAQQSFTAPLDLTGERQLHYRIRLDDPRLWWPNGYGEQPLYRIEIAVDIPGDAVQRFTEVTGLRQIAMLPAAEPEDDRQAAWLSAPYSEDMKKEGARQYNWRMTVNGRYIFVKGTNWCTLDALLRFPPQRYDRFLSLAKQQDLQLLRAWGGGMPESDDFYRRCDELGLMVQQEWPTCWGSPRTQPQDALCETVIANTLRLRNHPSLVRWAGGNELGAFDEPIILKMGALAWELDGTRPFHRTSPYAGSRHDYSTYWWKLPMEASLALNAVFIGEFGMASFPCRQSVLRYVSQEEYDRFDPAAKNAFNYHTPRFNEYADAIDMEHLLLHAREFWPIETSDDLVEASQLAQAVCLRHVLESQRANSPVAAGACYYKLTDVYPAASWSTVDYYGVPKIAYYVVKNAFAPVHAMLHFTTVDGVTDYPLTVLDDRGELYDSDCRAEVTAYDGELRRLSGQTLSVTPGRPVVHAGSFTLTEEQAAQVRLLTLTLYRDGQPVDRTFYYVNYRTHALRAFPRTTVALTAGDGTVTLENIGSVPAVGVWVECPAHDTVFTLSDNYLCLAPGERRTLAASHTHGLTVRGLNLSGD